MAPGKRPAKQVPDSEGILEFKRPSRKRVKEYIDRDRPTPVESLYDSLDNTESEREKVKPSAILHWFRSDLRTHDNTSLSEASQFAKKNKVPLITLYHVSWNDWEWHGTSPARIDYELRTIEILQKDLKDLNIFLGIIEVSKRSEVPNKVLDFAQKYNVSHIYANHEYEVDEVRRDDKVVTEGVKRHIATELFHDQTIIPPGDVTNDNGGPMKVFTPFHKAWLSEIESDPDKIALSDPPSKQDKPTGDLAGLFDATIPSVPEKKAMSESKAKYTRKIWPAGEHSAQERLQKFLKNAHNYANDRNIPSADATSRLSVAFASGTMSPRQAVNAASKTDSISGSNGVAAWVRQVCFRCFYRQSMVISPHVVMHTPQNIKFDNVQWDHNDEFWYKWCEGTTGFPYIDACMRQLVQESYMHNRGRMATTSFLCKNMFVDYRRGERFFMENLIDGDYSNNNAGHQPDYTVMNPLIQSEKFDKDGSYIRKFVPELKSVDNKAIHDPYHRLSKEQFSKLGYPEPCLDLHETKVRAIDKFKEALREGD